jgi:hypothetical protein
MTATLYGKLLQSSIPEYAVTAARGACRQAKDQRRSAWPFCAAALAIRGKRGPESGLARHGPAWTRTAVLWRSVAVLGVTGGSLRPPRRDHLGRGAPTMAMSREAHSSRALAGNFDLLLIALPGNAVVRSGGSRPDYGGAG